MCIIFYAICLLHIYNMYSKYPLTIKELFFAYRADLYDDDNIQHLMQYDPPWCYLTKDATGTV